MFSTGCQTLPELRHAGTNKSSRSCTMFALIAAPASAALVQSSLWRHTALRVPAITAAIDPEALAAVSVYDSVMEGKLADLQATTHKLEAEVADLKKALETKSDEVEKFAESVESQIKDNNKALEAANKKVTELSEELKQREEEVAMINAHLEAHTGASQRFKAEAEVAKKEAELAKAELAEVKAAAAKGPASGTPDPAEAFSELMSDEDALEEFAKAVASSKAAVAKEGVSSK